MKPVNVPVRDERSSERQNGDAVRNQPSDPVCPSCNGVCLPKRGYVGFSNVYIVLWVCQACGKKVLTHNGKIAPDGQAMVKDVHDA